MGDQVFKLVEVTGTSTTTLEEAVQCAISRAAKTVRNMRWFEVKEIRGHIDEQQVKHWQVTVKIGFTLDE